MRVERIPGIADIIHIDEPRENLSDRAWLNAYHREARRSDHRRAFWRAGILVAAVLLFIVISIGIANAQAPPYTPVPPANVPTMPAPAATLVAGASRTFTWAAVTQWNDNTTIAGSVYYDIWEVSASGVLTLVAGGLTSPTYHIASLTAGLHCYVVDAAAQEAAGTLPPYGESNASNGYCLQVNAPAAPAKTPYGPDNFTSTSP